ncbi:family 16 glycosylhydrolase [Nocardioides sp. zg-1228]|uniref:glycoside hydrolase family 16 protein n=1 Tax=Nocardioides sp. zg-1228 TaxID=2763008 RepID=UPI001642A628|nr:glycoside hydrolase family 16 protein [Nocardioides sp. zg-1228]MBC2934348.1 glycoside hydrolase family 16 protein [Nocardioides sp. zg-1228]QSF59125.1 glycoside hydrolase family 16 protein [Nocardioides sp. zg-1228]
MWVQDFAGAAGQRPDPRVWTHDLGGGGWGDRQRQVYTDDVANAALDGAGHLAITARREPDGTVTSARLTTRTGFATTYGRVEARIKVPGGRGTWPAFWMLGTDIDEVGWPGCGEIDVMEHVGADPGRAHGTVHGPGFSGIGGGIGSAMDAGTDLSEDFHDYAVVWDRSGITWRLDGREHHRVAPSDVPGPWPFDHAFFLLVNLAIGGDWPGHDTDAPELPAVLLVDRIRVEALP